MIYITYKDINISSASDKSGVFNGENYMPAWTSLSKSNTVVSGNNVSNSINILNDNDGYDYTVFGPNVDGFPNSKPQIYSSSNKKTNSELIQDGVTSRRKKRLV